MLFESNIGNEKINDTNEKKNYMLFFFLTIYKKYTNIQIYNTHKIN